MKKTILTLCIALSLVFSVFCQFYLNSQEISANDLSSTQMLSTELALEKENSEVYFPDVALVEKASSLLTNMFKIF